MKNLKKLKRNEMKFVNGGCMAMQCTANSCPENMNCVSTTCGVRCTYQKNLILIQCLALNSWADKEYY